MLVNLGDPDHRANMLCVYLQLFRVKSGGLEEFLNIAVSQFHALRKGLMPIS
ncbi:MAG TPA: hypothetical protein VN519_01670 [Bryobacteraceae bacterium]|nr:hypothetical protein [Bryobacteraceae bacterium]